MIMFFFCLYDSSQITFNLNSFHFNWMPIQFRIHDTEIVSCRRPMSWQAKEVDRMATTRITTMTIYITMNRMRRTTMTTMRVRKAQMSPKVRVPIWQCHRWPIKRIYSMTRKIRLMAIIQRKVIRWRHSSMTTFRQPGNRAIQSRGMFFFFLWNENKCFLCLDLLWCFFRFCLLLINESNFSRITWHSFAKIKFHFDFINLKFYVYFVDFFHWRFPQNFKICNHKWKRWTTNRRCQIEIH